MRLTSILLAALVLPTSLAHAEIVNGDFATGDLTGWDVYDPNDFLPFTYLPGVVESNGGGGFQARMTADQPPATTPELPFGGGLYGHVTSIFQTFTITAPATIAVDFEGSIYGEPDAGSGAIQGLVNGIASQDTLFTYELDAPLSISLRTATLKLHDPGTYRIELYSATSGVLANNEASASAELVVHNVYLLPIPEPATWLLAALAAPVLAVVANAAARRG